jgi:very-short-patch-repair endonuclease
MDRVRVAEPADSMTEDLLQGRARGMRREPTDAERKMWRLLRGRQLGAFKFRRQEKLVRFIVDFVCFEAMLIVELDGSQHAESGYDRQRDAWLKSPGFRILRFWNAEMLSNVGGVQYVIARELGLNWQP